MKFTKKQLNFIRSKCRMTFSQNPIIQTYKKSLLSLQKPFFGGTKRKQQCARCAKCKLITKAKELDLDHIEECGSFSDLESMLIWYKKLYCGLETGLQLLCKRCHNIKTYSNRYDLTEYDAKKKKWAINIIKNKSFCKNLLDIYGHCAKNDAQRKEKLNLIFNIKMKELQNAIKEALNILRDGEDYEFYGEILSPGDFSTGVFFEDEVKAALESIYFDCA